MSAKLLIATLLILLGGAVAQSKSTYYMDSSLDCGYIGLQDVSRSQTIKIHAKTTDTSASTQLGCTIHFQASDNDATIKIDFESFIINTCDVKLYVSGDGSGSMSSYSCGDNPSTYFSIGRTVTLTLHRTSISATEYNFQLKLVAVRDDRYPLPSDSNPIAVGLVIGIVGSIFGVIVIASICGICCFRKYRARQRPFIFEHKTKEQLHDTSNSVSVGYTNESMSGSPMSKKKLLAPSDSSDEKEANVRNGKSRFGGNKNAGNIPPPPPVPKPDSLTMNNAGGNRWENQNNNSNGDESGKRGSMLNALSSNPRFRNSFKENEKDAEERARKFSSNSFDKFGRAPSPPPLHKNMSSPSMLQVPKSPKQEKSKRKGTDRPSSFSSDELNQIERNRMRDDRSTASSGEVSDMQVNTAGGNKKKGNTTHSLKPDRKGGKGRKKQTQSVSSAIDDDPKINYKGMRGVASADRNLDERQAMKTQKDRFLDSNRDEPFEKMGSGRYSKRSTGRKSPRPPGKSSGRGFSHRRGRSMDQLDSRPTTPTSLYGSMEDLDMLPLRRSNSKTSIYSSRSTLYDRRRRRKGSDRSFTSMVSHVRDDISVGRHSKDYDDEFYSDESDFDGYEKPLSRRDRNRLYRSENDLGRRVKEIATQTLRETATQTGAEESVVFESKRLVKKKRRSKSLSSSGTQTAKKEKKTKTKSTEKLTGEKSLKSKRSKSVPDHLDSSELESIKPRPKPKPRKSASAAKQLDTTDTSAPAEQASVSNINPYLPQTQGAVQQPGFMGQPAMPAGYPYPMQGMPQGMPQGYPGYPAGPAQPQQLPSQPMMPPPPPMSQPEPRQPRRSNWEILCEMTGGRGDVSETGSVASSVFTNNPAHVQGYAPTFQPPAYNAHQFYLPADTVQAPQQSYSVGDYENAMNGRYPQDYENANFRSRENLNQDARSTHSSWNHLKDLTEQPRPQKNVQDDRDRTESMV